LGFAKNAEDGFFARACELKDEALFAGRESRLIGAEQGVGAEAALEDEAGGGGKHPEDGEGDEDFNQGETAAHWVSPHC